MSSSNDFTTFKYRVFHQIRRGYRNAAATANHDNDTMIPCAVCDGELINRGNALSHVSTDKHLDLATSQIICFCAQRFPHERQTDKVSFYAHIYTCLMRKPLTPAIETIRQRLATTNADPDDYGPSDSGTLSTQLTEPYAHEEIINDEKIVREQIDLYTQASVKEQTDPQGASSSSSVSSTGKRGRETTRRRQDDSGGQRRKRFRFKAPHELARNAVHMAFLRFLSDFTLRQHSSARLDEMGAPPSSDPLIFVCSTCRKSAHVNQYLKHCKEHSHDMENGTLCVNCNTYFFYIDKAIFLAQFYRHVAGCLVRYELENDEIMNTRFVQLTKKHCLPYVYDEPAFSMNLSRRAADVRQGDMPSVYDYFTYLTAYVVKLIRNMEAQPDVTIEPSLLSQQQRLIDFDKHIRVIENEISYLTRPLDELYSADNSVIEENIVKVENAFVNGFHCATEIRRLRIKCQSDLTTIPGLREMLATFGTNERLLQMSSRVPSWLTEKLSPIYNYETDECFDNEKCGFSSWLVALSTLIGTSSFVFVHVFLYERSAKRALDMLAEDDSSYLLPHSCLCYDKTQSISKPDNLHRHMIVLFMNNEAKLRYSRRVSRTPKVGAPKKTQYCLSIRSKHHFFNAVHYVSSEKVREDLSFVRTVRKIVTEARCSNNEPTIDMTELIKQSMYVGSKEPSVPRDVGTDVLSLAEYAASIAKGMNRDGGAEADKMEDGEDEEPNSDILATHTRNGSHVYILQPSCSHWIDLASVMYEDGFTRLLGQRQMTDQLFLALIQKSKNTRVRVNGATFVMLTANFADIRNQMNCTLVSHVLPYKDIETLDGRAFREKHDTLKRLGVRINEQAMARNEGLNIFRDFDDVRVIMPTNMITRISNFQETIASLTCSVTLLTDICSRWRTLSRLNEIIRTEVLSQNRDLIKAIEGHRCENSAGLNCEEEDEIDDMEEDKEGKVPGNTC